jgi:hypothetical protein
MTTPTAPTLDELIDQLEVLAAQLVDLARKLRRHTASTSLS